MEDIVVVHDIGTVRGGWGESSRCILPEKRETCVFQGGPTFEWEQGEKGNQGGGKVQDEGCDNSGAGALRTHEAVELLVELTQTQGNKGVPSLGFSGRLTSSLKIWKRSTIMNPMLYPLYYEIP